MDRVAQLAAEAKEGLRLEARALLRGEIFEEVRTDLRSILEARARRLGFPENEISAAIDTALAGR